MKTVNQLGLLVCFCCFALVAFGQQNDNTVREMFDNSADVEWVRNLEGTVNGMHPIAVSLGFDGTHYNGILTILDDDTQFHLIGSMDRDLLILREIDDQGLHTGYLFGSLEEDRFSGQWWSSDMSRSADIRLMEEGLILLKQFEPRMTLLQGEVGEEAFECILFVESMGVVSGTWQRADECVRMMGQCEDQLCTKMVLMVSEGALKGSFVHLDDQDDGSFKVGITNDTTHIYGVANVVDDVLLRRHAKTNYSSIIDFIYPEITQGEFNNWVESKYLKWNEATMKEVPDDNVKGPETRWSIAASGWLDVFLYSDHLISGLITFFNPEEQEYNREHFIYDTEEGREIEFAELGKKDGNLLSAIQANIHVEGIKSNEFKYPVLTKSGFFVCTEFDAVAGDKSAMVPYSTVEKAVKRKVFFTKIEH